jgi:hypothetical protein
MTAHRVLHLLRIHDPLDSHAENCTTRWTKSHLLEDP